MSLHMSGHKSYELFAHITWHTWRRVGSIDVSAAAKIRLAVAEVCEQCAVRVLALSVLAEHVHLLVSYRPSTRLSEVIGRAKGLSSYRANRTVAGAVRWGRGYFASSVSKKDVAAVFNYVTTQHRRHPDRLPRGV